MGRRRRASTRTRLPAMIRCMHGASCAPTIWARRTKRWRRSTPAHPDSIRDGGGTHGSTSTHGCPVMACSGVRSAMASTRQLTSTVAGLSMVLPHSGGAITGTISLGAQRASAGTQSPAAMYPPVAVFVVHLPVEASMEAATLAAADSVAVAVDNEAIRGRGGSRVLIFEEVAGGARRSLRCSNIGWKFGF